MAINDQTIRIQSVPSNASHILSMPLLIPISTHEFYNADTEPMTVITLPRTTHSLITQPLSLQQHITTCQKPPAQDNQLRTTLAVLWIVGMAIILLVTLYVHFLVR